MQKIGQLLQRIRARGNIISARQATKQDSFRLHTFGGGEFGPLGYVAAGQVRFAALPWHCHTQTTEFYLADIHKSLDVLPQAKASSNRIRAF